MSVTIRYPALPDPIAGGHPIPGDAGGGSGCPIARPASVSPQPLPWNTQAAQPSDTPTNSNLPPAYDPRATYRTGDTVTMNGRVYTLSQAPGAPRMKGIAPDTYSPLGPNPWWYQGSAEHFHDRWSNSAASISASNAADASADHQGAMLRPNIRVSVYGNNVTIDVPVQFKGAGLTPERQAAMVDAIQKTWSGHFGRYDVTTRITTPPPLTPVDHVNTITVLDQPGISTADKNNVTIYTSEPGRPPYSRADLGQVAAHETGHLMGEQDRYALTEVHGVPDHVSDPGYEHNLMGNRHGVVDERNIEGILRRTR
jgi:hypothetical protein